MSTLPQTKSRNGAGSAERKKVTLLTLREKRRRGEPITMVTAYDYPSALAVENAGLDMILVGDSLGMVVLGYDSTVPVTMDEMIHHAKAVRRGASHPFLVGDMPFMSYQADAAEAVRNAGRFLKEAGMDAIKLEGGREVVPIVQAIVRAGIPVMGHIGLTPQSVSLLGGYRVQGKTAESARALLSDALALQEAGCFSLVLESVPAPVAKWITRQLDMPTIGIGAGAGCSGQVLVYHDLVGMFDRFTPKFVKRYARLHELIGEALAAYRDEVVAGTFPAEEHTYPIDPAEWQKLEAES
jgi:3-methyl-2-oxobutanoate hydroxymethyltransferase